MFLFVIHYLFRGLYLLLVVYAVMSWFVPYPKYAWQRWVTAVVEPLLHPIRALIPPIGGMDLSPIIAALILMFLQQLVLRAMFP